MCVPIAICVSACVCCDCRCVCLVSCGLLVWLYVWHDFTSYELTQTLWDGGGDVDDGDYDDGACSLLFRWWR